MKMPMLKFLQEQYRTLPLPSTYAPSLAGKTVIITGANVGLGFETAKHLATLHPGRLILACRDPKKAQAAVREIQQSTGSKRVEAWQLDISSNSSVKAFAEKFAKEGGGKLDVLIENAGVNSPKMDRTPDGWEKNIGVNHLGTSHLAFRMLPFLLQAPQPRLVIVASAVHYFTKQPELMNRADLLQSLNKDKPANKFEGFDGTQRYNISKTMNVLWARALAKRIPSSSALTVTTVAPGFCISSLLRDQSIRLRIFASLVARTTEVGSRTIAHAAVAPEVQGKTGVYLSNCEEAEPSDFVISKAGAETEAKLWDETLDVLGKVDPEVPRIVQTHLCN